MIQVTVERSKKILWLPLVPPHRNIDHYRQLVKWIVRLFSCNIDHAKKSGYASLCAWKRDYHISADRYGGAGRVYVGTQSKVYNTDFICIVQISIVHYVLNWVVQNI